MTLLQSLPILGICGWSGSGKTTLIEAVLPSLRERGISVAVVKHDAHGVNVDRPGKDSDRLFRAGADVYLTGDQHFQRLHLADREEIIPRLMELSQRYDLLLIEGHKGSTVPKVWLPGESGDSPPPGTREVMAVLPRDNERPARFLAFIEDWFPRQWKRSPVWGCILIGGKSSRMGRPKHLITNPDGQTWLEKCLAVMREKTKGVAIVGEGELPPDVARDLVYQMAGEIADAPRPLVRLPDVPDVAGPLSGLLAAQRFHPGACWLVAACDMPCVSGEAMDWLLGYRAPGVWAVLPRCGNHGVEPLLAFYDFRTRHLLEAVALSEMQRLQSIAGHPKVLSPAPPTELLTAWTNVNTPDKLVRLQKHAN